VTLEQRGVKLPFTMGHEIAGEVVALGPDAKGVQIGARYAVYPWIGCGTCAVCAKGEELLCLTPRTLGTRTAGGYATHVVVPHPRYLVDYGTVPQGLAATYTCSGITAFSALKKLRDHVGVGDHFLVIGAGGVGGQAVHIAPTYLGGEMLVADIDAQKRAHAVEVGAAGTIDNGAADALQQVLRQSDGGVAGAIDFVGSPKTMDFGINALRKGGKLVMVGLYGGAASVSTVLFPFKMMSIEGSYVGTLQDLKELLELGQAGKITPIPVEMRSAERATESLADLKRGGKVRGRVVMTHE
jgi:D-arabinose 1-dehydrogenase-like Zn-dependent alcohol dehydrogenase